MPADSLTACVYRFACLCVCVCGRLHAVRLFTQDHANRRRHVRALCDVCCSPAGTHHMSPLQGPGFLLPGPPWPPAHTPQAADAQRERQRRSAVTEVFVPVNPSTPTTLQPLGFMYTNVKHPAHYLTLA